MGVEAPHNESLQDALAEVGRTEQSYMQCRSQGVYIGVAKEARKVQPRQILKSRYML